MSNNINYLVKIMTRNSIRFIWKNGNATGVKYGKIFAINISCHNVMKTRFIKIRNEILLIIPLAVVLYK